MLIQSQKVTPTIASFYLLTCTCSSCHVCLGCYDEESMDNASIIYESNLTIMAPGFCQEICLDKNALDFAIQVFVLLKLFWPLYPIFFCHLWSNLSIFTRQESAYVFQVILITQTTNYLHQPVPTRVKTVRCCQVNVEESQHTTYTWQVGT